MVCYRCGDPHRLKECQWSGKCSICGQDHKNVVSRKNPNAKLRWEPVTSSSASSGTVQMMAVPPSAHLPVPPTQQCLLAPTTQYLLPPPATSPAPVPQSGAYWLPNATTPSTPIFPWVPTPTDPTVGASSSTGAPGVYAMPSVDSRDPGDVVTGIISVDSFVARALFDSGASFSFVSEVFVGHTGLAMQMIGEAVMVSSARGPISSSFVCPGCVVSLADEDFVANLVVIPLEVFDVILGMDWLLSI